MRIRIINGSYGLHDGRRVMTMTARSGAFEADDAEAAALIAAGVAAPEAPQSTVASRQSPEEVGNADRRPQAGVGGGPEGRDHNAALRRGGSLIRATETGDGTEDGDGTENSAFRIPNSAWIPGTEDETVDYLTLGAAQLRELCDERGIPYKKNAGVKTLAALLAADDDRPLPELTAADPVLD